MPTEKLALIITGDSKSAVKSLKEVGVTSEKELGKAKTASDKQGAAAKKGFDLTSAAAAVGGAAIAKFGFDAINAYEESAKVAAQTNAVLISTGNAANVSAEGVANLASEISRKTGIDDEAIQSGENLLLTFTNVKNEVGEGNDIFNQATKTLVDMSAALGQDTKTSAIQLGKALNDPIKGVTALQRVGVSFTAQQKEQIKTLTQSGRTLEAQKIILAELKKEFGGTAEAIATPFDKLKVSLGNVQEALGGLIAPQAESLANAFSLVATGATDAGSSTNNYGRIVKGVLTLGGSELPGIKNYFGNAEKGANSAAKSAKEYGEAQKEVANLVAEGKEGTDEYNQAVGRLNAAKTQAQTITDGLTKATQDGSEADKDGAESLKKHEDALKSYTDAIFGTRAAARSLLEAQFDVNDALIEYKEKQDAANTAGGKSVQANQDAAEAYLDLQGSVDGVAQAALKSAQQQAALEGRTLDAAQAAGVQRDALLDLAKRIDPNSPLGVSLRTLIAQLDQAARGRTGTLDIQMRVNGQDITRGPVALGTIRSGNAAVPIYGGPRAGGGPVSKNRMYMVGEEGPELFVPNQSGRIIPNGKTASSGGFGGGNVTLSFGNITLVGPANGKAAVHQFIDELEFGTGKARLVRVLQDAF